MMSSTKVRILYYIFLHGFDVYIKIDVETSES